MWCWWFQFVPVCLHIWTWIADTVLIFNADTETIILEWNQIPYFACAAAHSRAHRNPIAFGQLEHFDLIGDWDSWCHRYRWFPAQCQTTIGHFGDDWTISQRCWSAGLLVLIEISVQITDCRLTAWLKCYNKRQIFEILGARFLRVLREYVLS